MLNQRTSTRNLIALSRRQTHVHVMKAQTCLLLILRNFWQFGMLLRLKAKNMTEVCIHWGDGGRREINSTEVVGHVIRSNHGYFLAIVFQQNMRKITTCCVAQ